MKRREAALRAAVAKLDMPQEAKDMLVRIWREVDGAYAEQYATQVRDLKARLRACRAEIQYTSEWKTTPARLARFTDLRRKKWRTP